MHSLAILGDIQVDANGLVHLVTGLTDSTTLTNAIVEIYETAPNVWAGKVITAAHDKSKYGYEANTPGLGQTGPSIMIASNMTPRFLCSSVHYWFSCYTRFIVRSLCSHKSTFRCKLVRCNKLNRNQYNE